MKRLLLICGIAALLVTSSAAARQQPQGWISTNDYSTSVAVPQQPGVTNPSAAAYTYPYPDTPPCGWASTDRWIRQTMLGGASPSDSMCLFQDWTQRSVFVDMVSSSQVTITVSTSTGFSQTVPSTLSRRSWAYQACIPLPVFQLGDLQEIPGSGGGFAIASSVSIGISGTAKQVSGYWGYTPTC